MAPRPRLTSLSKWVGEPDYVLPVDDKVEKENGANGENHGQPDLNEGKHFAAPYVNLLRFKSSCFNEIF